MSVPVQENEQVTQLLNDCYQAILARQVLKATDLKAEIDTHITNLKNENVEQYQDQNLLLYYALLDFKYKLLTDQSEITKNSFDTIKNYDTPVDNLLSYYFHFFKAIHNTMLANYIEAKDYFEKAEQLLKYVPNEIEKAEFNYKLGVLYYHMQQPLLTIKHATKAKEIYEKHTNYAINQIECDMALGAASITLNQFELAEEYFIRCLDLAKKYSQNHLVMLITYDLGFLYAQQNLSETAIRYLTEVYELEKEKPYHKTLFLLAREYFKLGQVEKANHYLEEGIKIADIEYTHHFNIIQALYDENYKTSLESVITAGIEYFEAQQMYGFIEEYAGYLAKHFYTENNPQKASVYFNIAYDAKQTLTKRSALK